MKLQKLRVRAIHPVTYKPHGCTDAEVTGVFWDEEHQRICFQLLYDNGYIDWHPLIDFWEAFQRIDSKIEVNDSRDTQS